MTAICRVENDPHNANNKVDLTGCPGCCLFGCLRYCSSYANANVEQLKALLFNYDDQTTRFKRIKTWQDVGLIRVGSAKLEALLRPSPER